MTLQQAEFVATKTYPFQNLRYLMQQLGVRQGVVGSGDYVASQRAAGANMSVDISAGGAFIKGVDTTRQGLYHQINDAAVNVVIPASNGSNPRLDQVVLQANDSTVPTGSGDTGTFVVVQGTATAGATLENRTGAATLPPSCMPVCDVLVPTAAVSIVNANIRDRRPPSTFLGINIPTTESISSTSYTRLATADQVANVELPPNGLIVVGYHATWQESVADASRAAIFLGANQLQAGGSRVAAPQPQAASRNAGATANQDALMSTWRHGLMSGIPVSAAYSGDVTTGQTFGAIGNSGYDLGGTEVGPLGDLGGDLCMIFANPGTYDVSVKYKASSGSVTAKNRRMIVGVLGAS